MTTGTAGAASLRESRRVLELYAEAIAGRRVELRPTADLPDLSAHVRRDLPTSSARCIFLPAEVDEFSSDTENFALYKIAILHQLGFWECGTYAFALAEWRRRAGREAPVERIDPGEPAAGGSEPVEPPFDLEAFFAAFPRPVLARHLFAILEDTRIDAHLARRYRGIRRPLAAVLAASLAQRPRLELLAGERACLEALVQLSLGAELVDPPADGRALDRSLEAALPALRRAIEAVRGAGADVYTTALAVLGCTPLFGAGDAGERRPRAAPARPGAALAAKPEATAPRRPARGASVAASGGDELEAAVDPVPFRGAARPELVQKELRLGELEARLDAVAAEGSPLPPDLLRELLERGEIEIEAAGRRELDRSSGLSVTDLPGLADRARNAVRDRLTKAIRTLSDELEGELGDLSPTAGVHYYDEWDHERSRYRRAWCRLTESRLDEESTAELDQTRREQARLFTEVRRQFELLRPDARRVLKRLTDGEEVDLDAAVEAHIDRVAGLSPSEKVYMRRDRRDRDVAAAFLLDMSASTDSEVPDIAARVPAPPPREYDFVGIYDDDLSWAHARGGSPPRRRRVIDVEKEALLLMTEALDALGDAYGVYGFSGHGREHVEFYVAKDFAESCDRSTRGRIAAISPKRSTRMGPAIRHATRKLRHQDARVRVLLVLSDGYPQDFDYGRDRTSRAYGIQDTMMALREAELQGIHTFCLTVDPAGHDYLREMCPERQYLVIDDVAALPRELPKVYRGLTT
ncbi:MAG TPA: hypothetical protein VMS86_11280 [Thermoanaerobaculia bacterium]|nr:hypothetical protein [Thermoanaerobaculia bacterium]